MCIKFILFYTVVFSLKQVLSGVNVDNTSNQGDIHRISFSQYQNAQNSQNKNKPSTPLGFTNIKQEQPMILHQQLQNVKDPTFKPGQQLQDSLLPYRQPSDKIINKSIIRQQPIIREEIRNSNNQYLPSKKFENLHIDVNQLAVTTQRNLVVDDKHKIQTSNTRSSLLNYNTRPDFIQNENRRIISPSPPRPLSKAPTIDGNQQHSNKLKPFINNDQTFPINRSIGGQQPTPNQQNLVNHQGNMQPLRTLQNLGRKVQTNNSYQNKRFAVIHKNGGVEYFDDLEIILKRYPHVTISDNVRKLFPIQSSVSLGNIKNNRPLAQYPNYQNVNAPPQKMPMQILNNPLKPRIGNISQMKNTSQLNESSNFKSLETTTPLQVKLENKAAVLQTIPTKNKEMSIKSTNTVETIPTSLQENKPKNFISDVRISRQPETIVTTKVSSIYSNNDTKTPLKNLNSTKLQKSPIDMMLNNETNLSHQENKTNTSPINKRENSKNIPRLTEKGDLHSNKSKEMISSTILNGTISHEVVKTPNSENHLNLTEVVKNNSTLQNPPHHNKNHETVADKLSKSQLNNTEQKEVKQMIDNENIDKINKSVKDDVADDYDEDFLSLAKPLLWFSTTDPEFWKKLVNIDDNPSFLYIINVQPQPKVEKDRKTTIHANGTIVEEITETVWNSADDEPKITRTIKITPANAVVDE